MVLRIIPARAGPTPSPCGGNATRSDHPRSCGANPLRVKVSSEACGSSPLVRGQRDGRFARSRGPRIIPARAGPTSWDLLSSRTTPDHPRSCGANGTGCTRLPLDFGSSPLVRGQLGGVEAEGEELRIIPARAGPTPRLAEHIAGDADHPRSCGANVVELAEFADYPGSSPLVRGQQFLRFLGSVDGRIIPARAGPTRRLSLTR